MNILILLAVALLQAPPAISDSNRAKFWRAVHENTQARAALERSSKAIQDIQAVLQKECGGGIVLDGAGEPQCAPPEKKENGAKK